jgi:hypothetical protein
VVPGTPVLTRELAREKVAMVDLELRSFRIAENCSPCPVVRTLKQRVENQFSGTRESHQPC